MPLADLSTEVTQLRKHLDEFAREGLRTLVLGVRKLDGKFFSKWNKEYEKAKNLVEGRDKALDALHDEVEMELDIVGATAIEDKLQENVRKKFV